MTSHLASLVGPRERIAGLDRVRSRVAIAKASSRGTSRPLRRDGETADEEQLDGPTAPVYRAAAFSAGKDRGHFRAGRLLHKTPSCTRVRCHSSR